MYVRDPELARLQALHQLHLLDSPPEQIFDDIIHIGASLLRVPVCAMSLIDENRNWFKSSVGVNVTETPRAVSFCDHAIRQSAVFVVHDTIKDPRFSTNPLVAGEFGIRFYAGAPICHFGYNIGAICVIDTAPRHDFSTFDIAILRDLADLCEDILNLRTLEICTEAYEGPRRHDA